MRKIDYSKRGPLIKVQIGPGRFVKMYERDAIARGLVKKERPQVENKMMVPEEDKSTPSPSSRPSPTGEEEMTPPLTLPSGGEGEKRKRKRGAVRDREVGGSNPPAPTKKVDSLNQLFYLTT